MKNHFPYTLQPVPMPFTIGYLAAEISVKSNIMHPHDNYVNTKFYQMKYVWL